MKQTRITTNHFGLVFIRGVNSSFTHPHIAANSSYIVTFKKDPQGQWRYWCRVCRKARCFLTNSHGTTLCESFAKCLAGCRRFKKGDRFSITVQRVKHNENDKD